MIELIIIFAMLYTISNQYIYNLLFYILIILLSSLYILNLYSYPLSFLSYFLLIIQIGAISILFGIAIMLISSSPYSILYNYLFILFLIPIYLYLYSTFPPLSFPPIAYINNLLGNIGIYWYTSISYSISLILLTILLLLGIFALFVLLHYSL